MPFPKVTSVDAPYSELGGDCFDERWAGYKRDWQIDEKCWNPYGKCNVRSEQLRYNGVLIEYITCPRC